MLINFLLILFGIILIYCLPPTVGTGDISELVAAASSLGIAHSPGYPLFCNVYKIGISVIPFGDYGYKAAVVSVILYLLTALIIGVIINKLTKDKLVTFFAITYCLSQETLLKQSTIGEVFALHNLIVAIIFYLLAVPDIDFYKKLYLISFFSSLGLGNQHIIVFVYPSILIWIVYKIVFEKQKISINTILLAISFFLLGITIYFYIPLRAYRLPLYSWEDPRTIDRFLYLVLRKRYGTLALAQGGKFSVSFVSLLSGLKIFFYILGRFNVIFFIISFIVFLFTKKINKEVKFIVLCFLITLFLSGPFFISITGLKNITPNNLYILERLIVTSVICLVLIVSLATSVIKYKFILFVLILYTIFGIFGNIQKIFQRNNFFVYDYTINLLRNLPRNCILFSDRADETEFLIAYFQRMLKKRQDISFVDCNASVTRSIYGDEYYKIWGQPRLKIRTEVENNIIQTSKKQVFYSTVLPQQTGTQKFKYGLVYSTKLLNKTVYDDIFIFRNFATTFNVREYGLYITHLLLLASYYLELAEKNFIVFPLAEKYYKEVFYLTGDVRYMYYIPYFYYSKNKFDTAINEYLKLLSLPIENNERAEILTNLGVVYEKLNKFDNAEKFYLEAIHISPNYPVAYYNLGSLYWKVGRKNEAVVMFQKYLLFDPDNEQVKKFLSYIKK